MKPSFEYLPYLRNFRRSFNTAHGVWARREGIIIRVETEEGGVGFGEIAPLPIFGTETLAEALQWCRSQAEDPCGPNPVPGNFPCCQWALATAQGKREWKQRSFPVAALVDSLEMLKSRQQSGYRTFKLKIGVGEVSQEMALMDRCIQQLDRGRKLRLDANGALCEREYHSWLEFLEGKPVEFLEQPMKPGLEHRMLEMADPFSTTVALDESVVGMRSLTQWKHWPGPLVVKPSLLGSGEGDIPLSIIGSSVFETSFGLEAALQFLARHQKPDKAIGFDTLSRLNDDGWCLHQAGPTLSAGQVTRDDLQALWEARK